MPLSLHCTRCHRLPISQKSWWSSAKEHPLNRKPTEIIQCTNQITTKISDHSAQVLSLTNVYTAYLTAGPTGIDTLLVVVTCTCTWYNVLMP